MQSVNVLRGTLAALIAAGIFLIVSGLQLRYYVRTGPGPGFFPIWIGGLLAASALYMLVETFTMQHVREAFFESRDAALRVGTIVLCLLLLWVGLQYLGFRLAVFGFALVVPQILGRQSFVVTAVVALIASFGVGYAFEKWLMVYLPSPGFEFLQQLGF